MRIDKFLLLVIAFVVLLGVSSAKADSDRMNFTACHSLEVAKSVVDTVLDKSLEEARALFAKNNASKTCFLANMPAIDPNWLMPYRRYSRDTPENTTWYVIESVQDDGSIYLIIHLELVEEVKRVEA